MLLVQLVDHLPQDQLKQLRIARAAEAGSLLLMNLMERSRVRRQVQVVVRLSSLALPQLLDARADFVGVERHVASLHVRCVLLLNQLMQAGRDQLRNKAQQ